MYLNTQANESLPPHVQHEAGQYRRLNHKTPNREVATLFGRITLWRHGYRYVERDVTGPTIFPLEISLGLVEGATSALACAAGQALAEAGATQEVVLERRRSQHGVEWGVKKLRAVAENVSAGMDRFRRAHQAKQAVDWLRQADASQGKHRLALVLGRDGITPAPVRTASSKWPPPPRSPSTTAGDSDWEPSTWPTRPNSVNKPRPTS